ncbi:allantoicase [Labedaea rhizosphaerae]|uniref:Probable allantoicase n=1 Tax=Labedaea rhizosphaerae TaxID=598644 RepID=A0A4R6SEC6_LABRH|nr:allantoicase [Labedaea rhizosphaerae]TDP97396.1 allantoicase [Labedaea rhizosphaerae]
MTAEPDWVLLPDLASRAVGGGVPWANDEFFAVRENLVTAAPPQFQPSTFGAKGQVYDGWETRRRRIDRDGADEAIVRLGLPGVISGVVVDTAFFTGNYPPEVSVQAVGVDGYPSPDELCALDWVDLVPRSPVSGDTRTLFDVLSDRRFTHVRLRQHPDGGVARLRVHGTPVPDPRVIDRTWLDLAALANGGMISGCSNWFYSSPANLISPGLAAVMGDGWETARRRDDGNDWVQVRLAGHGVVHLAELDTSHFKGNAPGWVTLTGLRADGEVELLPRTRLQPDTCHKFRLEPGADVAEVRMDILPDGGMARLRLWGSLTDAGADDLVDRFTDSLPPGQNAAPGWVR